MLLIFIRNALLAIGTFDISEYTKEQLDKPILVDQVFVIYIFIGVVKRYIDTKKHDEIIMMNCCF